MTTELQTEVNELNQLLSDGSRAMQIKASSGYNTIKWTGVYYGYYQGVAGLYEFNIDRNSSKLDIVEYRGL